MQTQNKIIIYYWLPVLLWCVFIYYLSSIPGLRSELPGQMDLVLRKFAHIGEYAALTFLFFRAASQSFSPRRALLYAVLFAFTFALTDEYHQSFVPGRNGNAVDVTIDGLGILLAFFIIDKKSLDVSIMKIKRQRQNK